MNENAVLNIGNCINDRKNLAFLFEQFTLCSDTIANRCVCVCMCVCARVCVYVANICADACCVCAYVFVCAYACVREFVNLILYN